MRKGLIVSILLVGLLLAACQNEENINTQASEVSEPQVELVKVPEVIESSLKYNELALIWKPYSTAYVSCLDLAVAMGWGYAWDADSFMFEDHEMQIDFKVGSLYVTRYGQIVDVMPQVPILQDQALYLSADWLEENFGDAIERLDDRMVILDTESVSLYDIAKYFPDDLIFIVDHPDWDASKRVMAAIELPRSMGIEIPRIDPNKMMNMRPVRNYPPEFAYELLAHGFSEEEIDSITYGEYEIIHSHWLLSEEMQELAIKYYPEYTLEDVSRWTYGELTMRQMADVDQAKRDRFSEAEWETLQERGIKERDISYLLKEFHQASTILEQSDEDLKRVLEGYYENDLEYWTQMMTLIDEMK